ncbi:MAG: UDP-N-acetylglucosamine 2-epimerase (non-hydrolyzing) [Deltaproteobacteria bacterium]|nr:UDP-N-acetylglucosamine 2-epimerase (non-hydrolyzing) [Deltaproteobacteria bacterium]
MKILHIVGARPNFMKAAPVMRAIAGKDSAVQILVHTGQHYDSNMSEVFFKQLGLPEPDRDLDVGSNSHAVQTAQIMMRMEEVLLQEKPDLVLVYGDVNSTMAGAVVCAKLMIPVGHVEAGLRSFDRTMPEEINRLITDQISDLLFTPSEDGNVNLLYEGVAGERIHLVGNVMIDTLIGLLPAALDLWKSISRDMQILKKDYALVTLHRPSNVDDPSVLSRIIAVLQELSMEVPVIFPVHPRTRRHLSPAGFPAASKGLSLVDPLGYLEFLSLQANASAVITDSGGIQEETTFLGVPCLTVRENTERPVTVDMGTNTLVGRDMDRLKKEIENILDGHGKGGRVPPLWDGRAAERIADIVTK